MQRVRRTLSRLSNQMKAVTLRIGKVGVAFAGLAAVGLTVLTRKAFQTIDVIAKMSMVWVSLKNYEHITIVFFKAAGTAGDDPTITVEQATAVAGTSNKALDFTETWTKDGTLTAVGTFTKNTQAAANTYTDATTAEVQSIWLIEIDSVTLDVANGFDCVQAAVADVGANAQLGCLLYILTKPRYAQAIPPSAIVD